MPTDLDIYMEAIYLQPLSDYYALKFYLKYTH